MDLIANRSDRQIQPDNTNCDREIATRKMDLAGRAQTAESIDLWRSLVPPNNGNEFAQEDKKQGKLVRYMPRSGDGHVIVETNDGDTKRFRAADFHPYFMERNPAEVFRNAMGNRKFADKETESNEQTENKDATTNFRETRLASAIKYKIKVPTTIKRTIPNPTNRTKALRYLEGRLCTRSIDFELDKLDANGTVKWLQPAELGIIPR